HPGFTEESMALFHQGPDGEVELPEQPFVAQVLRAYQGKFADAPSAVEGFTEGNLFALLLQRLHHDCERLAYRYRELRHSNLFRDLERLGIEAGHLERLTERVVNRVPDLLVNEIIVDEVLSFLSDMVVVRRRVARYSTTPVPPPVAGPT